MTVTKSSPSQVRLPRDQRRSQLIDVALDVFAENGYAQTTMDDIAQRAGVSKPVLYQHFRNKRSLFFTLLDQQLALLHDRITTAMQTVDQSAPDADEQVTYQAVQALFEFHADPRRLYRLLDDTSMEDPEELQSRVEGFLAELVKFVSPYMLDNSILEPAGSEFVTRGIAATVFFMATCWAQQHHGEHATSPRIPLDEAVGHTCRFVAFGATGFDLSNNP